MSHVRWDFHPRLKQPVLIAAFEGWNDAGESATGAIIELAEALDARPFATIDPEEFYDFTETRPRIEGSGPGRRILWPECQFFAAPQPDGIDLVLLQAIEPNLRWRTFCDQISSVIESTGAAMVFTLGALLADVPHTRPTPVVGTSNEPDVAEALKLGPSSYEGPTGIVGVLHDHLARQGTKSASLWAAVPSYVPSAPSPKATLAIVDRLNKMLNLGVDLSRLQIRSQAYERHIDALVDEDEETAAYIRELEEEHDSEASSAENIDELLDEVEQFLRDQ